MRVVSKYYSSAFKSSFFGALKRIVPHLRAQQAFRWKWLVVTNCTNPTPGHGTGSEIISSIALKSSHSINSRTAGCCHSTICSPSIIVITGTKDYSNFKTAAQSSSILRASSKEKESEREQRNKTEDSKYVVFLCTNERVRVIEVPMEIFESEGKVNRRCGNELWWKVDEMNYISGLSSLCGEFWTAWWAYSGGHTRSYEGFMFMDIWWNI